MASSAAWKEIFDAYNIGSHNFSEEPFYISASQIKSATSGFSATGEREVRILCKQDTRAQRPKIFADNDLFILPVKNGRYAIVRGEGYLDIPEISGNPINYDSKLSFHLDTAVVGNSEMQHLDMAYASSIIRTFMDDPSLVLTIRGRKYTPNFTFKVGSQDVDVSSVQTEVDAGYEGEDKVVLIEAKTSGVKNIIRQLFYPYKQWQLSTKKKVYTLFFERDVKEDSYKIWEFVFDNASDYNSIRLSKTAKYRIAKKNFEEKVSIEG
jgi:hypothetical protein